MNEASKLLRLLTVEIRFEQDVVLARQRARQLANSLGLEGQVQTRIATAVSEVARNAFQYAGGGRVEFSVLTEAHPGKPNRHRQTFVIEVRDTGPGIARLDEILAGRYRSESGLGIGIIGAQRLMDRLDIASSERGTAITLAKILPPSAATQSAKQLQAIVDDLSQRPPAGPLEEIQVQNQELIHAMEELARVNQELAETNRGVLALYDELETLNRISLMLASKLELRPLIQSIIDVTTTLTDAEVGVFFFHEQRGGWQLYASSGARADALIGFPAKSAHDFFGADFASAELVRIPDLELHKESCSCSQFATTVAGKMTVRSCLTVPVLEANERLIGVFLFASSKPKVFTERSERILTSVATQAAVSIEKARLYQTVTAASEAKDQFFAMLSHELRTPLHPALGHHHQLAPGCANSGGFAGRHFHCGAQHPARSAAHRRPPRLQSIDQREARTHNGRGRCTHADQKCRGDLPRRPRSEGAPTYCRTAFAKEHRHGRRGALAAGAMECAQKRDQVHPRERLNLDSHFACRPKVAGGDRRYWSRHRASFDRTNL